MAIVKTETLYINDAPFRRQVKFTKRDGFTCELPPGALAIIGYSSVRSDSMAGCDSEFKKAMTAWRGAGTTTREVIIYDVKRNACITETEVGEKGEVKVKCCLHRFDEISFAYGCALEVSAGVFTETHITMGDGVRYRYDLLENRLPTSLEHGAGRLVRYGALHEGALPWTQELQNFFWNIGVGMEKLILMFSQLKNQKRVLELANSGVLMLPSPKSPPEGS